MFCRTRLEVETLAETLDADGRRAQALHGGMEQRQRDRVMQLFRAGKADLLVATDVAARGLDIDHLSHVINYDVPSAPEAYVHRIGRTGRIGREGVAITLVDPREQRLLRNIESFTRQRIEITPLPTFGDLHARRLERMRAALRERAIAARASREPGGDGAAGVRGRAKCGGRFDGGVRAEGHRGGRGPDGTRGELAASGGARRRRSRRYCPGDPRRSVLVVRIARCPRATGTRRPRFGELELRFEFFLERGAHDRRPARNGQPKDAFAGGADADVPSSRRPHHRQQGKR